MALSALAIREYAIEQALGLLEEIGFGGEGPPDRSAHEVLGRLYEALESDSLPPETAILVRAEAMLVAGRSQQAAELFRKVVDDPRSSDNALGIALDRLGDISWWNSDPRAAVDLYGRSLQLRPQDDRTKKDLARAKWHVGSVDSLNSAFGADSADAVASDPGQVFPFASSVAEGVCEVFGLYVSSAGAGAIALQGCMDDQSGLTATGNLGTTAQEACSVAWSIWARGTTGADRGVRVHSPGGEIHKDGPSLGLAVFTLIGAVYGEIRPRPADCFTGELDLRGAVLPIGGAEKKALAAYLSGFRRLFLPTRNLAEVAGAFGGILELVPLDHVDQVTRSLSS